MKGGLSRRATLFKEMLKRGWPTIGLDVGSLAKGFGKQAEARFQLIADAYIKMGYQAVGLGPKDLAEAGILMGLGKDGPFISANVGLINFSAKLIDRYRVIQVGGRKVGVTAVLGRQFQKEVPKGADVELADPDESLAQIVPTLKAKADYLVLLANAAKDESLALAEKFPQFNVVVTAGSGSEQPPRDPQTIKHADGTETLLIEVGEKGMYVVVLGLYDDSRQPSALPAGAVGFAIPRLRRHDRAHGQLPGGTPDDGFCRPGTQSDPLSEEGQRRTRAVRRLEGLAVRHESSYKVWKKSGHSLALATLEHTQPPRNYDPECVSCHVVGWDPEHFFPYKGGYESRQTTPQLADVGCESCHGPGEAHVNAELHGTLGLQQELQKAAGLSKAEAEKCAAEVLEELQKVMRVTRAEAEKHLCVTCHDGDNSPDFKFETYWPFIEHKER